MRQTSTLSGQGTSNSITNINLDTINGFYHWGVFTSDDKVNEFIGRAYERTPSLQTINTRTNRGSITAALGQPRITVPGDAHLNLSKVLYQITFNSGTLESANKGSTNLEGWKIALQCDLDTIQVSLKDGNADSAPARDFIKNEFRVGDDRERADRLFVKLAEANWNRLDNSSMIIDPDTGKPISFNDWEDRIDHGADDDDVEDDRPTLFKTLVRIWARAIQREFATTLAISTPRSRSDGDTNLDYLTQIYAYESSDSGATGTAKADSNDSNCIVYLSMGQNDPFPQAKRLLYQGRVLSATKMTLVAGHQLYLDRFLLPLLVKFNAATSLSLAAENGWDFTYEVGLGASSPRSDDDSFHFARSDDGSTYTYQHEAKMPENPIQSSDKKSWFQPEHWSRSPPFLRLPIFGCIRHYETLINYMKMAGKTTNTFLFDAGSHTAALKGSVEYCRGIKISDSQDMSASTNLYRSLDVSSWEVKLSTTLKDGVLSFSFNDSPSLFENIALLKSELHKKVATSVRSSIDAAPKDTGISILSSDLPSFWGASPLSAAIPILLSNTGGVILALAEGPVPKKG
ncbi:hypothetical protein NUW58_g3130 [Xylaria curta]|uniref:Uncharacterized protein n=1 Tax=Xylaria curta TaxID=42375 RepID=A0ACC1PCW9_9PEZI|nr:hypothetical protein NUW58_g3130 [Xylaria curta]